jgi:hypothetical protein
MRRYAYITLVLLSVLAVCEAASCALHPRVAGRPFSRVAFADARRQAQDALARTRGPRNSTPVPAEDVLHPYLGFIASPVDARSVTGTFWGPLGWPPPRRDPTHVLVGILGGSFAGDLFVKGGARLKSQLSTNPRYAGREIVLFDMAYGGWKQPQQFFALGWMLALGGELDLLIDVDGFNEVALDSAENAGRQVFAAYPRAWAWRVDDLLDPADAARLGDVAARSQQRALVARIFGWLPLRLSPTASLAWTILDRRLLQRLNDAQTALLQTGSNAGRVRQLGPPVSMTSSERLEALVGVWQRSSLETARLAAASGIPYFQFLQPNQYDEGAKPMGADERRVAFREDHPYRSGARAGYPLLRAASQAFAREGRFFTDLSRLFEHEQAPMFADDCCHMRVEGYERVADAIAAVVRSATP